MKPLWSQFWLEYPDYVTYPTADGVKQLVGGSVDAAWIANTCAIRMSRGLNYSGLPVPTGFHGLVTVKGGDGKHYAIRMAEMRKWLTHVLGAPDFNQTKTARASFDKKALAGKKGILAFDIQFSDATGHLDAWDGRSFSHEYACSDYWDRATRITLWSLP